MPSREIRMVCIIEICFDFGGNKPGFRGGKQGFNGKIPVFN